jgi:hypothetical protein
MEILRTTYGEFSFSVRPIGGTEQIPGITILGDGRIVGIFDVAFELQGLSSLGKEFVTVADQSYDPA